MNTMQEQEFAKLQEGLLMALEAAHALGGKLGVSYAPGDSPDLQDRINEIMDGVQPPIRKEEVSLETKLAHLFMNQSEAERSAVRSQALAAQR